MNASMQTCEEWYYTRGSGATVQKWQDKFVLRVGYVGKPERKASKSNRQMEARSRDGKFVSLHIPKVFDSAEEASSYAVSFRRHVENVVRGDRPRRLISGEVKEKVEGNSLLHNLKKRMAFQDKEMKKRKRMMIALQVAMMRRQNWQEWRMELIKILDYHISNICTCLL